MYINDNHPKGIINERESFFYKISFSSAQKKKMAAAVSAPTATARGLAAVRSGETETAQDIDFSGLVNEVRKNFHTRKSYPIEYRLKELANLRRGVLACEKEIMTAVNKDLRKHPIEAFQAEVALIIAELDYAVKNLKKWMEPVVTSTSVVMQPGKSVTYKQPKGVALIVAPWNYPVQLCLNPLISAIAAGCAAVIKPSEQTPESAKVLEKIVTQYLDQDLYRVVQGAVAETTALLKERWNHIFYTGNGHVGRLVSRAAADSLSSCTLELGGKSPVYVAPDANVRVAARRILGTKILNVGQTCVAPDYALVHSSVRDEFIAEMKKHATEWMGEDKQKCESLARIVNVRHFDRLAAALKENHGGKIVEGGLEKADRNDKFLPFTMVVDPSLDSTMMQEEIFGPILPIITVSSFEEALDIIGSKESSLASYIFTESPALADKFIQHTNSGGTSVNDCIMHIVSPEMPFGGHSGGGSGVGYYHGHAGFMDFTHLRGTYTHSTWLDPSNRYMPYKESDIGLLRLVLIGADIPPAVLTGMKLLAVGGLAMFLKSKI